MVVGEIVVSAYSKAQTLKRKTYIITAIHDNTVSWNKKLEIRSPSGHKIETYESALRTLEEARSRLDSEYQQATRRQEIARQKLREFDDERKVAKDWFPIV